MKKEGEFDGSRRFLGDAERNFQVGWIAKGGAPAVRSQAGKAGKGLDILEDIASFSDAYTAEEKKMTN